MAQSGRSLSTSTKRVLFVVVFLACAFFIVLQHQTTYGSGGFLYSHVNHTNANSVDSSVDLKQRFKFTPDSKAIFGEQSSFANSSSIPLMVDVYERGHDNLDNANICPNQGKDFRVLMMVMSAPSNFKARMSVRFTWGAFTKRKTVGLAFLVGTTNNSKAQRDVEIEALQYRDVIRGRSIDSYENLTLKSVSMLEWVTVNCPEAPFILKTDDDMFINVENLLSFIELHSEAKRSVFGYIAHNWKPFRDKKNKYYISLEQFQPNTFPDFATGPSYLFTQDCAEDMFEVSLQLKFFKLEDVFLTGVVASRANISRISAPAFLNSRTPNPEKLSHCELSKQISYHNIGSTQQFKLWWKLFESDKKC